MDTKSEVTVTLSLNQKEALLVAGLLKARCIYEDCPLVNSRGCGTINSPCYLMGQKIEKAIGGQK